MYAIPNTNVVVSASANHRLVKPGAHTMTTIYMPCECGEAPDPEEVVEPYEAMPDSYEWTASAADIALHSSTWTGPMTSGICKFLGPTDRVSVRYFAPDPAKARLVDVFISYEPSDLPEDEDRSVKFLEFEAPPDSLYVPSSSANSDWYWNEFVSWWNGRGGNVSHRFEGKKRLVLHGHKKSESQRDCAIRITHPIESVTPNDEFARGRTMDADRISPNGGFVEWEF